MNKKYCLENFLWDLEESGKPYFKIYGQGKSKKIIERIYINGYDKRHTIYIDLSKHEFHPESLLGVVSEDHSNFFLQGLSDCMDFHNYMYMLKYCKDNEFLDHVWVEIEKIYKKLNDFYKPVY